jgi:hypothetical protein
MLLAHRALDEAKRHLLLATKLAPGEPHAPQLLGETLLLQGEAQRAAQALNAALRAGSRDASCRSWYEAALAYIPYEKEHGAEAVAQRVKRSTDRHVSDEQTEDLIDEESLDDPSTMDTRMARSPEMPTVPATPSSALSGVDLEPPDEVPLDEGTAIVGMEELRQMIEQDLAETGQRSDVSGEAPTVLAAAEPTANLAPGQMPAQAEKAPASQPTSAFPEPPPPIEPPVAPSAKRPPSAESAPVVEVPARMARHKPIDESAPVVEVPAAALERMSEVARQKAAADNAEGEDEAEPGEGGGSALPWVLLVLAIVFGLIVYGVRSGRLPDLERRLPPWITG